MKSSSGKIQVPRTPSHQLFTSIKTYHSTLPRTPEERKKLQQRLELQRQLEEKKKEQERQTKEEPKRPSSSPAQLPLPQSVQPVETKGEEIADWQKRLIAKRQLAIFRSTT